MINKFRRSIGSARVSLKKTIVFLLVLNCLPGLFLILYGISRFKPSRASTETESDQTVLATTFQIVANKTSTISNSFSLTRFESNTTPKNLSYRHAIHSDKFPLPGYYRSLTPGFAAGNISKNADIVIGITTVKRFAGDYLVDTLRSLINNLGTKEVKVSLVVYIGESDTGYVMSRSVEIFNKLSSQIISTSVLIQVVSPPANYYPDWPNILEENFGDDFERVKWRSKQNLDEIWLMMYVYSLSPTYYLIMEDDVIASSNYMQKIFLEIEKPRRDDWVIMSFCKLGSIGKLFHSDTLPVFSTFLHTFWKKKPLDWLENDFITTAFCNPGKSVDDCKNKAAARYVHITPSLFQHMGVFSSLKGKIQTLKDEHFST